MMDNLDDIIQRDRIQRQENRSQSQQSEISIYSDQIKDQPKKNLHPVLFVGVLFVIMVCCYANIYYIFAPITQTQKKGIVAAALTGLIVVVAGLTFRQLVTFREFVRLAIMVDNILLVTIAVSLAFVSLIIIFDVSGDLWQYKILEVGFTLFIIIYSTLTRVFLVHLQWTKWKVIVFKVSILLNCLMFLSLVVHFIYVDFTYTMHFLPAFDSKVKDFMLLYIFAMFSYTFELYCKVTDLDNTCNLKYSYSIGNKDANFTKKRQSVVKRRKQSVRSALLLGNIGAINQKFIKEMQPGNRKKSKFAQTIHVQELM